MIQKPDRAVILGFLLAVVALIVFGWLAGELLEGETIRFDAMVRNGVHSWASPALTQFMLVITWFGSGFFLIPMAVFVAWRLLAAGRRRAATAFITAVVGSEALSEILKLAFHRPRPQPFFGLPVPATYSFPSGHALTSACYYGVLAAILTTRVKSPGRRLAIWIGAAVMAIVIGLSRVYLGVHYPSDVVAGYAAAVIWIVAIRMGYGAWLRRTGDTRE